MKRAVIFVSFPPSLAGLSRKLRRGLAIAPWIVMGATAGVSFVLSAAQRPSQRIVSLVPALTSMLLAIDARPQLVAVSSYDDDPQVRDLPRVGALIDPDVERILSLKPDLVLVYGSQTDLITQLRRASIPFFDYRHGGVRGVTATIRALGERTGRTVAAERLAGDIDRRLNALRTATSRLQKPRTLLVFGRERGALRNIYASGGRGFLHDMLEAAGGINVFADVQSEAVQASSELILTRKPEVILELRSIDIPAPGDRQQELDSWKTLASVPAVRNNRVYLLTGEQLTEPGPTIADATERMARVLHPKLILPAFARPMGRELRRGGR